MGSPTGWRIASLTACLVLWSCLPLLATSEYQRLFRIREGVPAGTRIGLIGEAEPGRPPPPAPPYLVVPSADSPIDLDLDIDQNTGEMRSKVVLDRELRSSYHLSAIPLNGDGENIKVQIEVEDENDNAPTFSRSSVDIGIPENTARDSRRQLPPALDKDLGIFNTQKYDIVSGNKQNAFRLSSQRDKEGALMLDLIVNGFLDREAVPTYSLLIEAVDGGNPPLRGSLSVNVTILDLNDNPPTFEQQRYYASLPENATVGSSVLSVAAADPDSGPNGEVTYAINRRQSDAQELFAIDELSGLLTVNKRLDFESKDSHELVVVAKDRGDVPQETTAFITIRITDVNDHQPRIGIAFRTPGGLPELREDAPVGQRVAELTILTADPERKSTTTTASSAVDIQAAFAAFVLKVSGPGSEHFSLERRNGGGGSGYELVLARQLDRESLDRFNLLFEADGEEGGSQQALRASLSVQLKVVDINDNPPIFSEPAYQATILEAQEVGGPVLQVTAIDPDEGDNARVTYRIENRAETHSDWFDIEPDTGLITTRTQVDCETDPEPVVVVVASDNGNPRLSSSATIRITVQDINDNEPVFEKTFYNISLKENEVDRLCFLKVVATDPDCGVNSQVSYRLGEDSNLSGKFRVEADTGEICLASALDHEQESAYDLTVVAVDRGGLSTSTMVKVVVEDVNDNLPEFTIREYNATVVNTESVGEEVVLVAAVDRDSGYFAQLTYAISSGNREGFFTIDIKTGLITVARSLASAQGLFELEVTASDPDGNLSPVPATVFVHIVDAAAASESPPLCQQRIYRFAVPEDAGLHSVLGTVNFRRGGGGESAATRRLFLYPPEISRYFEINPESGTVATAAPLDHERASEFLVNVGATTGATTGYCQIHVSVVDVNDNPPQFGPTLGLVTLPENSPPETVVFAKAARDRDSGPNGQVNYRLVKDSNQFFSIDEETGVLRTKQAIDYEKDQGLSVKIVAYDLGVPPLSSTLTLSVLIQDVNDNRPTFETELFEISVAENLAKDSQILPLSAKDLDRGKNGRLLYEMLDAGPEVTEYVGLLPNSGILYLKKELDYEKIQSMEFGVQVADHGLPPLASTCRVRIAVADMNDNAPTFSRPSFSFAVAENSAAELPLGRVEARDKDSQQNGRVVYRLRSGSDTFSLDQNTGEIRTVRLLDREEASLHQLEVEAIDGGVPRLTSTATVSIQVLDENDNAPVVIEPVEQVVSVRERQLAGTTIMQVIATDPDMGDNASLQYAFSTDYGSDYLGFHINPATGLVTTRRLLERSLQENYTLHISITDTGSPAQSTRVSYTVMVLAMQDIALPYSRTNLLFQVAENVKIGTPVGSVRPNEPNFDLATVWFSIPAGGGNEMAARTFDIDGQTGSLVVTGHLDADHIPEYRLKVWLNDNVYGMAREVIRVRIVITDVNDNPPAFRDSQLAAISVPENAPVGGGPLFMLSASDVDGARSGSNNGSVRYSLVDQFPSNYFRLDALSGELFLAQELDFETAERVFLTLSATDSPYEERGRQTSQAALVVNVEDVNDHAPEFVSADKKNLQRDKLEVGIPFLRVLAVDADSGPAGEVRYQIVGSGGSGSGTEAGSTGSGLFQLDSSTGLLSVREMPPAPVKSSAATATTYRLTVRASDNGSPSRSTNQLIQIVLMDGRPDGPPKFSSSLYKAEIGELAMAGTPLIAVSADKSQQARGGGLVYSLDKEAAGGLFDIDITSGSIVTAGKLDREERDEYILTVYVKEGEGPSQSFDTATVLVRVLDENDNAPVFQDSCYPLSVPENTDLSGLHYFIAVDKDEGPNGAVTYSIVDGDAKNKFSIDANTGQLSALPLDHEDRASYSLKIRAQDQGTPSRQSSTCEVTIRVMDRNDNDPVFSEKVYKAVVSENMEVGTQVLTVKATDADAGLNAKISYSIQNGTEWIFGIDKDTGVIYTTGRLDRELRDTYSLVIVAVDEGIEDTRLASTTVKIEIQDENDSTPEFDAYPFMAAIQPDHPSGAEIVRLTASDGDKGQNADLRFGLLNPEVDRSRFAIDPGTGIITAAVTGLGLEDGGMYHLEVIVTDGGTPSLSSTGLVEIRVGDQPAVTLNFQQAAYSAAVAELAATGSDILQVQAVRSDGRKQRVIYSFGQGNEDGAFEINSNNGLVRLQNPQLIDFETKREFQMTIIGHAAGDENLYAYASLTVSVLDRNDNEPRFTQKVYFARTWEGNNKGTFVAQVVAVDGDSIEQERLYYQIVDGNHDGAFVIDQQYSGIIKTNIVLDREIRDLYELTVTATDEGSPPLTGYTKVIIKIIDINDNQPQFPPVQPIVFSEGLVAGSRVGSVQANDIDTHPHLIYAIEQGEAFSIDKFSGVVSLRRSLDREAGEQYNLTISASDGAHKAVTEVQVLLKDENDCAPEFDRQEYIGSFSSNMTLPAALLTLRATDRDSGRNGRVSYHLLSGGSSGQPPALAAFNLDPNGTLWLNNTATTAGQDSRIAAAEIHLVAVAEDGADTQANRRRSFVSIRLSNLQHTETGPPQFGRSEFSVSLEGNIPIGGQVASLAAAAARGAPNLFYSLEAASSNPFLEIDSTSGALVIKKRLSSDLLSAVPKVLGIMLRRDNRLGDETHAKVNLNVSALSLTVGSSAKDGLFTRQYYDISLSENTATGNVVFRVAGLEGSEAAVTGTVAAYDWKIAAGNLNNTFQMSRSEPGSVVLRKPLDYELVREFRLIVLATRQTQFQTLTLIVKVVDENDNVPFFPVPRQTHSVAENLPPGSLVFIAAAVDLDGTDALRYTLTGGAVEEFVVGETSGRLATKRTFDYEQEQEFQLVITATDSAGSTATADITIRVESADEFYPAFESTAYQYSLDRIYPVGQTIGRLRATDRDAGPDGRIVYSLRVSSGAGELTGSEAYFRVDPDSGEIAIARSLDTGLLLVQEPSGRSIQLQQQQLYQDVTFAVQAASGRPDSLKTTAMVTLHVRTDILPPAPRTAASSADGGLAVWGQALIIVFVLAVVIIAVGIFLYRRFSLSQLIQKRLLDTTDASMGRHPYDAALGQSEGGLDNSSSVVALSQYPPPQYSDIVSQYSHGGGGHKVVGGQGRSGVGRLTLHSELSEQSHRSASSGRGSAEDVEEEVDQEIQMINGGGSGLNDTSCLAEDTVSEISIQNGKEYLARLGIDTRGPHLSHTSSYQTLEGHSDVYNRLQDTDAMSEKNSMVSGGGNSVYARTGHPVSITGSLSSIVHSEEEIAGSYNWDYLLDWGPQYQPLQHVFQEISSLKDESGVGGVPVPPLLTSQPPRHAHSVSSHPRSPISHELLSQAAMSPSFSPALSPLATRSPSISPLGNPSRGMSRGVQQTRYALPSLHYGGDADEKELRI